MISRKHMLIQPLLVMRPQLLKMTIKRLEVGQRLILLLLLLLVLLVKLLRITIDTQVMIQ